MSAQSITLWNSIPLDADRRFNLKRSRVDDNDNDEGDDAKEGEGEGDDGDDDDISIASRTPSPQPMDVDKYDEYIDGPEREVVTVETKIKSTNKGFAMLSKLGWAEGQPLGLSSDGRVDPVPFQIKQDLTGLGKIQQDVRMIETTVSQRRGLDSERQRTETEEQRRAREDSVARRTALSTEISTVLRPFYCALCEKQFKTVAQYDEHTNSYAHHHKARSKDVQTSQRAMIGKEETERRKEKERKREEKELRKIAKAQGIKIPKPTVPTTSSVVSADTELDGVPIALTSAVWAPASAEGAPAPGFKKSGWATLGATPPPAALPPVSAPPPSYTSGGWASRDAGSPVPFAPTPPAPPPPSGPPPPPPPPPTSEWPINPAPPHPPPPTSGWSSSPAPPPTDPPSHRPPTSAPPRSGWSTTPPSFAPSQGEGKTSTSAGQPGGGWQSASTSTTQSEKPVSDQTPQSAPTRASTWQKFQKSSGRRR